VAIVFFLAVAALAEESIISYDAEDHKHEQSGDAGNAVRGSYSHTDVEGNTYTVTYVADENGYRAEGGHLPVAPQVPVVVEAEAASVAEVPQVKTAIAAAPLPVPYFGRVVPTAYHVPSAFSYGYGVAHPFNYGYAYNHHGFPYVY